MNGRIGSVIAGVSLALLAATSAGALWNRVFEDDFSTDPAGRWTYDGVGNATSAPLFRYDAANQRIDAEWSETNALDTVSGSYISNSYLFADLGRVLTDRDTFRLRATLRIEPGSIPDTQEFWQLATIGFYNLAESGRDRAFSSATVKDVSDAVEFNYFIGNAYGGPSISGFVSAHRDSLDVDFSQDWAYGPSATFGIDHWLPTGMPLYVESVYHGAGSSTNARRLYTAIYTNEARTDLLVVNNMPAEEWTSPLAASRGFAVSHVALVNYVATPFMAPAGEGAGSYDDVVVEEAVAEGRLVGLDGPAAAPVFAWAAVSGDTYRVLSSPTLEPVSWTTVLTVQAQGPTIVVTGAPAGAVEFLTVEPVVP